MHDSITTSEMLCDGFYLCETLSGSVGYLPNMALTPKTTAPLTHTNSSSSLLVPKQYTICLPFMCTTGPPIPLPNMVPSGSLHPFCLKVLQPSASLMTYPPTVSTFVPIPEGQLLSFVSSEVPCKLQQPPCQKKKVFFYLCLCFSTAPKNLILWN